MRLFKFYLIVFSWAFISCQVNSQKTNAHSKKADSIGLIEKNRVVRPQFSGIELANKAFEEASPIHFTDSCKFYFECDCCSGKILFHSDSSFYLLDYCMSDLSVSVGMYKIIDNILKLNYSGICVSLEYNWENEVDSSAVDYFLKDTIYPSYSSEFEIEYCAKQLKITESALVVKSMAIELKQSYKESLEDLEASGIIQRINILNEGL